MTSGDTFFIQSVVGATMSGERDFGEVFDLLRRVVFAHKEIRRLQAVNRLAIFIENGNVELDEVDAGAKNRRDLILPGRNGRG